MANRTAFCIKEICSKVTHRPRALKTHCSLRMTATHPTMDKDAIILVNLSGRGDKDVAQVADLVNSGAFVPAGD